MKTRTLIAIALALVGATFVQAQRNVQKTSGTNNITEDLTFGSGRTLTAAAGSTVNIGAATVTLPADVPRLSTFTDPNTDTVWLWDDTAGAWVLSTFTMSVVTSGVNIQLSGDSASPGASMVYGTNGAGVKGWYAAGSGGAGSVTSVGLSLPAIFTVSGSPVTSTGTLTGALASQTANTIFAAPNGSAGTPTFRAMVAADVPNLTLAKITDAGGAAALNVGTTAGTVAAGNHNHTGVYQDYDADLDDLADGSLTGTKVGFADTNSDFAATNLQAAIEELVSVNVSGPNASDGKVSWSQLTGVPAGFADGNDDGGVGGSGSMTTAQEGGVQVGGSDIVTLNFDAGFDLAESPDTKITVSLDGSEIFTGGDLTWSTNTPSIAANAVALGTDTTGNYVATVAGVSNQTSVSGSGSETAAVTVGLADNIIVPTTITVPQTGLHILDTDASHDLIIAPGSNLTADRQLTITTGDAARSFTLAGDLNVSGAATLAGTNTGDQTITLSGDVTGSGSSSLAATISTNAVSDAKLRQSAGLAVIGNATNATANVADITAASDHQVLRRSGTALGFGAVNLASSNAVTGALPVANGGTGLTAGTSGGVPYFSGTSTVASSGALTANGVVLGGGAGAAPTSTGAGTANQVLRIPGAGGSPAFGAIDLSQAAAVTGTLGDGNIPAGITRDSELDDQSEQDALGIVTKTEAQTIEGQKTFSVAPIISRTDLAGGTTLAVGTHYWDDAVSSNRTLVFSGTSSEGISTSLKIQVTGVCTFTIPTSKRLGEPDSAITSILLYPGNHVLAWTYLDSEWTLADTLGVYNNTEATSNPGPTDDAGDGYSVLSQVVNTSNGTVWVCRDASVGSAIWEQIDSAGGDASTNTSSSVDNEVALFSGTGGKTLKRATGTGFATLTSGVLGTGTASSPISYSSGTLSIANAAADGSTKGAASFAAADFDATSGNISIDYANAQKASGSVPGFLTSSDWSTFNSKQSTGLYRTIYIDAAAMVPRTTNGAAVSTTEAATNDIMIDALLFDGATGEGAQWKLAMPDEWDRGTIKVKIYWDAASGASAADTVEWEVSAGALSNDDAIDAALGTAVTVGDAVLAVGDVHITAASSALTVGGSPALADMLIFQIVRDPSGTDDMAEDARLLGVAIQYRESTTEASAW